MGHHHHHDCDSHSDNAANIGSLKKVLVITALFMIVEIFGGIYTNSLALLSDSAHMFTDIAALGLSLFAFYMSSLPATDSRSFGYHRLEILAAFVNGIFLVIIAIGILWGAWSRYNAPVEIKSLEMLAISVGGLIVNLVGAWILTHGNHEHPNMKGALFHIIGDALGSLGAITAALLTYFYGMTQADSLVSIFIAIIIVASAFRLILDTAHVILEGTPGHLKADHIRDSISQIGEVQEVHDLHVWSITSGMVSLSVHVVSKTKNQHVLLCQIRDLLKDKFHIDHVTIQIEDESLRNSEPLI